VRVVHFEIHAGDPERARLFYEHVFGWNPQQWDDQPYWLITTGSAPEPGIDGALLPRRGPEPAPGAPVNGYVCTVAVDDLDGAIERAMDAGGAMAVPRMTVPGVGHLAYVNDTEGNLLGLLQRDVSAT
jgi:predicted enzyme related to lactoylglutathione lyase